MNGILEKQKSESARGAKVLGGIDPKVLKARKRARLWYESHKNYCKLRNKKWLLDTYDRRLPERILTKVKHRCKFKERYIRNGIKNFLTLEDIRFLCKRDEASKMKFPSIDRKDNMKDYTLDNCQIIEYIENIGKRGISEKMRSDVLNRIKNYLNKNNTTLWLLSQKIKFDYPTISRWFSQKLGISIRSFNLLKDKGII